MCPGKLLRAKGFVALPGERMSEMHAVGARVAFTRRPEMSRRPSHIVVIGVLTDEEIVQLRSAFRASTLPGDAAA